MMNIVAFCMLFAANLASGAAVANPEAQRDINISFTSKGNLANYRSSGKVNVTKETTFTSMKPLELKLTPLPGLSAKTGDSTNALVPVSSCLTPRIAADPEDCDALCAFLEESTEDLLLPALEIQEIETGTCGFGVANLWPCGSVTFSQNQLGPVCRNMLSECVRNGEDGFVEDIGGQNLAFALYGLESAPPYTAAPGDC
ncbi:hypothetical protein HBH70_064780 [Parastagonospora nodorum]|nr:hypothetical protein HBI74_135590 [Parastagonospora nodorum]KAH5144043.1 hypothetical protein HBH70_064780 [Parastagonospora nodorum]KAH5387259.1 hypothetical protein HBI33_061040 [Parastagonospora nodorum]KAH5569878.1 hypothetical protein HBI25_045030 [Parastagonospora nodorum]KAH5771417.1 hypothetical protein HBI17_014530 [Parastagonospora nodorum]